MCANQTRIRHHNPDHDCGLYRSTYPRLQIENREQQYDSRTDHGNNLKRTEDGYEMCEYRSTSRRANLGKGGAGGWPWYRDRKREYEDRITRVCVATEEREGRYRCEGDGSNKVARGCLGLFWDGHSATVVTAGSSTVWWGCLSFNLVYTFISLSYFLLNTYLPPVQLLSNENHSNKYISYICPYEELSQR